MRTLSGGAAAAAVLALMLAAAPAHADGGEAAPRLLLGGQGGRSALTRATQNGVTVWKGRAVADEANGVEAALAGAPRTLRLERRLSGPAASCCCAPNRLKTHGFYSGGARGRVPAQGFYSGRR